LPVVVAGEAVGLPLYVEALQTVTTVLQDVTLTDKEGKAELKLQVEMVELLGQELLPEVLQEHLVTEVKLDFGKLHLEAAEAADIMAEAAAGTMVAVQALMAAAAVAQDHLLYQQEELV
jgi:ferredoxin-fold anticodon binding domain-containing protein